MLFGLLRHGETVWNCEKRVQGHGDSPLTPTGRKQAHQWGQFLLPGNWQLIVSSNLGRARETARLINETLRLPTAVHNGLSEQNWGHWEGLRVSEVKEQYSEELEKQVKAGWHFRAPGGESRSEVKKRIQATLKELYTSYSHEKILIISHLGVIKCCTYSIAARQFLPDEPPLIEKNCLHEIELNAGCFKIKKLNIRLENS